MKAKGIFLILFYAFCSYGFVIHPKLFQERALCPRRQSSHVERSSQLYMGRAAAVRAATKARTDSAKAKNNNRFAKAIINVVKQGGPDPESNRNLAVSQVVASFPHERKSKNSSTEL